ncbi:FUN14 domain-containing protein [Thermococcus sp. JCM 11816]|uniref:FUN14 domain-containing protein n=1 Tax=Thermococcus sp. (strain JCM 11816 / KS-1) TaxID=1295125 RepID=UPI0006D0F49B
MEFDMGGMFGGDLGVGAIVGFVTGYALKKFVKIVMTLIGAYLLSLFWLQQKGVITINTDKLFNLSENVTQQVLGLGQKALGILPGTGAFVAGFYLGFKKG